MSDRTTAEEFVAALRAHGVRSVAGVPCGHLAGPWELFDRAGDLTPAASEGAALALAAGWELAGRASAVFCQNSGFGNLINPLTSLVLPYRVPVLVVMTLRGWPDPETDEPQHAVMGSASVALLDAMDVPHTVLWPGKLQEALDQAAEARSQGRPFFLLVPRGAIGKTHSGYAPGPAGDDRLTRGRVVAALMAELTDELLVTTTGYLSRQAHHERDRDGTFYMQGSMGHAAAVGLGLAIASPDRRTVVLDGDGAFLMHLGTGSTIGASGARNLTHIVVDNGCYESTGCQPTSSHGVDWTALGEGLGYGRVLTCDSPDGLVESLRTALTTDGPTLLAFTVVPTPSEVHDRATASLGPVRIADRFREAAAGPWAGTGADTRRAR